jgi:tripartite-type tricarboxylate transporter receptor subunit TctC
MITRQSRKSKVLQGVLLCGFFLFVMPIICFAQNFPTKSINVLEGYAPGGAADIVFRPLASAVEKILGQPVVITNNGAGNGTVALGIVAKQKPDGYYLGMTASSLLTNVPHLRSTLPYKLDDFVPIMTFGVTQNVIVVKADAPWKTFKELVAAARQNPGKITYFAGTTGTQMDLNVQQVARAEKVEFTQVPFPGGGPALTALLGGHISFFGAGGSGVSSAKAGTTRVLAIMSDRRMKDFPDAPSYADLGYKAIPPDAFMVYGPKGIPPALIKQLDEAFAKAMKDPQYIQAADKIGLLDEYRDSEKTKKNLDDDFTQIGKLLKEYNIPKED